MSDDRYDETDDEPARSREGLGPEQDFRLPPSGEGRTVVTVYGVATLVLAGLLTLGGCLSGVGSALCFSGANSVTPPPSAAAAANPNGPQPAAALANGCGALAGVVAGLVLLAFAVILAVATVVHLVLAGGQFAAGVGVLRRRPWARILALVLSFFTLTYGGFALYQVGTVLANSPDEASPAAGWLVLAAVVGVLLLAHAVLSWVVMFHPACAGEFQRRPRVRADDFSDE